MAKQAAITGPHLGRALGTAVVPVELEAECVLHLGCAGPGEAAHAEPRSRVGGQPVDVVPGQTGVGDGPEAGIQSEVEVSAPEPPADFGLPDAGDGRLALGGSRS